MLLGVSADSAVSLGFIMGVVVCGASGVVQGVISLLLRRISSLVPSSLCGVALIILVNVTGGSGVLRISSAFSIESNLTHTF